MLGWKTHVPKVKGVKTSRAKRQTTKKRANKKGNFIHKAFSNSLVVCTFIFCFYLNNLFKFVNVHFKFLSAQEFITETPEVIVFRMHQLMHQFDASI